MPKPKSGKRNNARLDLRRWHRNAFEMKATAIFSATFAATVFLMTGCQTAPSQKFNGIELFNGKNFDGWTFIMKNNADPMKTWSVGDGVMRCTGKPLGYARTIATYHDYTLTYVWRFVKLDPNPKVNNTGILVHIQPPDVVFPECVQCQGLYQHQGDLILEGGASSDDHQVGKKTFTIPQMGPPNESPVGEWSTNQVICQGGNVRLFVNGKAMNRITGCNLSSGYIGIQSEGGDIEIRSLTLEPL
jgi:Domain of Unknown Function (DUF1080)